MKVRATRLGFYGNRRRKEGQEFILDDPDHFSKNWMESVEGSEVSVPKKPRVGRKPKKEKPVPSEPEEPTGDAELI